MVLKQTRSVYLINEIEKAKIKRCVSCSVNYHPSFLPLLDGFRKCGYVVGYNYNKDLNLISIFINALDKSTAKVISLPSRDLFFTKKKVGKVTKRAPAKLFVCYSSRHGISGPNRYNDFGGKAICVIQ